MGGTTTGAFAAIRVEAADAEAAGRVAAEVGAQGASGLEEREDSTMGSQGPAGATVLVVYAPAGRAAALREALAALGPGVRVDPPEPVPDRDWTAAWREGLAPVRASPRLVVSPFVGGEGEAEAQAEAEAEVQAEGRAAVEAEAAAAGGAGDGGLRTLRIEPGQAFGTGHHASTRLALALLDEVLADGLAEGSDEGRPALRVLDVGTGSGVLALAALALGAVRAVGLDVDPMAVREAARNARANGLEGRLDLLVGSVQALGPAAPGARPAPTAPIAPNAPNAAALRAFDLVTANLLRTELLPVLPALAARLAPGGRVVLSGLLAGEGAEVESALARVDLHVRRRREERQGDERWLGLTCARGARGPAG